MNDAVNQENMSTDWQPGIIILIYKKDTIRKCNNYREIIQLSIPSKLRIVERSIRINIDYIVRHDVILKQCKGVRLKEIFFNVLYIIKKADV